MSLNSFKFFSFITLLTIITYYFQHIRSASFVYEDVNWLDYHRWSWHDLTELPSNRLTLLTFWHNSPKVAHSINLVLHVINALILSLLIGFWFFDIRWIVGSLFLVNPLATQAVAYASGRGELLSLTFLLIFIWFSFSIRDYWPMLLICLLGMATTKATTLVVAIPLLIWAREVRFKLRYLILASLLLIAAMIYKYLSTLNFSDTPINHWFAVQNYAVWNLLLIQATIGKGLSIDHAWWLASYESQIAWLVCLVVAVFILLKSKCSAITFGLGWWIIAFSPRLLATVSLGWIREQHAYIPLVGFCILLASILYELELFCRERTYCMTIPLCGESRAE